MLRLARCYRYPPYHYFKHHLYLQAFDGDPCDFVPPVLMRRFIDGINPESARTRVFDKTRFAEILAAAGLPGVPTLAVVDRDGTARDPHGRRLSFAQLLERLTTDESRELFVKPVFGVNGAGVLRAFADPARGLAIGEREVDEAGFFDALFGPERPRFDSYLVQPAIRQHRILDEINPSAVNTVRIDSFAMNGEVATNGAVLRIGSGHTCTDNWSTGGMIVAIDMETGELGDTAKTKASFGRRVLERHPVTGFPFRGVKVPHWGRVKALVRSGGEVLRPLVYLGWDIAIGKSGPVIIEANHPSDVYLLQEGVGGLRSTRLGREVIEERR